MLSILRSKRKVYHKRIEEYKIRVEYIHQLLKIDGCAKEIKF